MVKIISKILNIKKLTEMTKLIDGAYLKDQRRKF